MFDNPLHSDYDEFALDLIIGESYDLYCQICGHYARDEDEWMELETDEARVDIEKNGLDPDMTWGDYQAEHG